MSKELKTRLLEMPLDELARLHGALGERIAKECISMNEEELREQLESFGGLIQVLIRVMKTITVVESHLTEYQKLLDGRWFESIKALSLLDERLTDLEKISGHLTSIVSGANLRLTGLEQQVEEHRKRWLE